MGVARDDDRYPNCTTLFGAYFHQDFDFDYGSHDATIDAYVRDVGVERLGATLAELQRLASANEAEVRTFLATSGNAFAYEVLDMDARAWVRYVAERIAAAAT